MFTIRFDKPFKKNNDRFCINIMHHVVFHSFKSESHKLSFPVKGQKVSWRPRPKPTRMYNTRTIG